MPFVTEPLVCPLGGCKRRAYLRESAFLPRESIPTSTVLDCQSVWCVFTYSLVPITRHGSFVSNGFFRPSTLSKILRVSFNWNLDQYPILKHLFILTTQHLLHISSWVFLPAVQRLGLIEVWLIAVVIQQPIIFRVV